MAAAAMNHWATNYIGTPWRLGAPGPDAFDCYSFARYVQLHNFGRQLPDALEDTGNARGVLRASREDRNYAGWQNVAIPEEGDIVMMCRNGRAVHIGVWVLRGVLHCLQRAGVIYQLPLDVRQHGFSALLYYRAQQ